MFKVIFLLILIILISNNINEIFQDLLNKNTSILCSYIGLVINGMAFILVSKELIKYINI